MLQLCHHCHGNPLKVRQNHLHMSKFCIRGDHRSNTVTHLEIPKKKKKLHTSKKDGGSSLTNLTFLTLIPVQFEDNLMYIRYVFVLLCYKKIISVYFVHLLLSEQKVTLQYAWVTEVLLTFITV